MTNQDPDTDMRFPINEADVEYWTRTIRNELTAAEALSDAQYIKTYTRMELGLHRGLDWRNKTPVELKADFMLYVNFISPI